MIKLLKNLPFFIKLMLAFGLSLSLALLMTTVRQITTTYALLEEKSMAHLDALTQQVILNFDNSQKSIEASAYSAMTSFAIPANLEEDREGIEMRNTLSMMLKASAPYNYIMVRSNSGQRSNTGAAPSQTRESMRLVEAECNAILDEHQDTSYGLCEWIHSDSGEVYLLRDVYDISPLRHVGTMVLHMQQPVFAISSNSTDVGFLFFDHYGEFITYTGLDIPNATLDAIVKDAREGAISQKQVWEDEEYFVVQGSSGSWSTIAITSTRAYQEACTQSLYVGLILGGVWLCLGVLLVYILIRSELHKLKELKRSMAQVAQGDFGYQIEITDNDDISQLAVTFNYMSQHIAELLEQLVEKERMRNNAELQVLEYKYRALETQIRPHFIYNALETINAMAKIKGEDEITEIVQRISRYFRNITMNITHQFITVQQEFDSLQDYTEIYRFIHGDRLRPSFSAREAARNAMIPTMIVQPVVENALHYGLRGQNEDSEIQVHAYTRNSKLLITVKDRGPGLTPEQIQSLENGQFLTRNEHSGIGLANVRERLDLIYGDQASITMGNREGGGVKVTIEMPFTYSEPDDLDDLEELEDWEDWDDLDGLDDLGLL